MRWPLDRLGSNPWFPGTSGNVRHREEAQQQQRLIAGISSHVLLAGWNQQRVPRPQLMGAAVRVSRAPARQHVNTLFEIAVMVRPAWRFARGGNRNLHQAQRNRPRALLSGDELQRG